jgi:hypothetical protein
MRKLGKLYFCLTPFESAGTVTSYVQVSTAVAGNRSQAGHQD